MPRVALRTDDVPEMSVDAGRRTADTFVLAVDLGTSGPKAALVSADGRIEASAFEAVDVHLVPGGGAEQDASAWWDATVSAAGRALSESAVSPDKIVGWVARPSGRALWPAPRTVRRYVLGSSGWTRAVRSPSVVRWAGL